jgi:hypothetical protein
MKLRIYDVLLRKCPRFEERADESSTLIVLHTIDFDAIPIAAFQQIDRLANLWSKEQMLEPIRTMLCVRERGSSRLRCFDVQALCVTLISSCEGPPPFDIRHAIFAIACAWAMGGCDFVQQPAGTRPSLLFESMLKFLNDHGTFAFSDATGPPTDRLTMLAVLRSFANTCTLNPQATAQHRNKLHNCDDTTLRQSIWTASYWQDPLFDHGCSVPWEEWGFQPPPFTSESSCPCHEPSPNPRAHSPPPVSLRTS